jgi:hypothetical protein
MMVKDQRSATILHVSSVYSHNTLAALLTLLYATVCKGHLELTISTGLPGGKHAITVVQLCYTSNAQ